MPLLHIEPEELRFNAYRLMRMAEEIEWAIQRLENAGQILQAAWLSDGRMQFQSELDVRLQTLRQLSDQIKGQSARLQREAARWEEISNRF
jgi:uncharacterized protein YukE